MQNPLKIAPPPRRPAVVVESEPEPQPALPVVPPSVAAEAPSAPAPRKKAALAPVKFRQVKEDERVQFNKRVTRRVADGFEMLAIRSRRKVPELLAEALDLLEERYGRVG
jgi:hypothetical protein